jgi:hypothetical protein
MGELISAAKDDCHWYLYLVVVMVPPVAFAVDVIVAGVPLVPQIPAGAMMVPGDKMVLV